MPIATDALIADTSHMSAEQFGAYVRLLLAMWRHGGRLTARPAELARIAGVGPRHWKKIAPTVVQAMTQLDGALVQKRLLATWDVVQKVRARKRSAATTHWKRSKRGVQMQC